MENLELISTSQSRCCFCFKTSNFISNNQGNTTGIVIEVYNSCKKYIHRDYLNADEFLNWQQSKPLPFCRKCLRWTLRLTQMNNELEQIQKKIQHLVHSFTVEFVKLRENPSVDLDSDIEELSISNSFMQKLFKIKLERPELNKEYFTEENVTETNDFEENVIEENIIKENERAEPELSPFREHEKPNVDVDDNDLIRLKSEIKSQKVNERTPPRKKKEKSPRQKKSQKTQLTAAVETNIKVTQSDPNDKPSPHQKVSLKETEASSNLVFDLTNEIQKPSDGPCSDENGSQSSLNPKSNNEIISTTKPQKVSDKVFKCNLCDKSYANRHYLKEHQLTHDQSNRFKCTICKDVSYAYIQNLRSHLIKHKHNLISTGEKPETPEKRFKCQYCSKSYTTNYQLKGHERTHENKRFECTVCGVSYAYIRNLRHHLWTLHNLYLINCENQTIIVSTEKPEKQPPKPKENKKKYFECKVCGKKCNSPGHLYYHRIAVHEAIPHTCTICNRQFRNMETLKCHNRKIHGRQQKHQCTICNKEFKTSHSLKEHTERHNRDPNDKAAFEKFKCPTCQKTLSTQSNLKYHILRHSPTKRFECPLNCGKRFSSKSNLETHIIYHKGEKTFLCEECGAIFFTPAQLKNHTRIHTGLLHFCQLCGKGFQTTTNLKKHSQSHDKKKKKTPPVSSSSTSSSSPVIFINEQMADRKYTCAFCDDVFDTKAILTEHMSLHDSDADDSSLLCFPLKNINFITKASCRYY